MSTEPDDGPDPEGLDQQPHLLRLAFQLTHDRVTAQDLVQDCYLRYAARRDGRVEHPAAYLRRILLNEFLAGRRRRRIVEVPQDDRCEPGYTDPDRMVEGEQHHMLWAALSALPDRQRAALVLRHYEQLSDAEIAVVLGVREATVRSLCHRGLSRLRSDPAVLDADPKEMSR